MKDDLRNANSSIREFTKVAAGLPWAMSLFGIHQTADLLNPRSRSQDVTGAAGGFDAVTRTVVEQFSDSLKATYDMGDRAQAQMIDAVFGALAPILANAQNPSGDGRGVAPIFSASSRAGEEVLLCYTRGAARFSADNRYIAVDSRVFLLDGQEFGVHEGVSEALFQSPQELFTRPDPPSPPLNEPVGPVQKGIVTGQTKARWAFNDGELFAAGPLTSHLVSLSDGSVLLLISAAQVVTNGTGRFQGVFGLTQSLGAAHVPPGVDPFGLDKKRLFVISLDTFKIRVVRAEGSAPGRAVGSTRSDSKVWSATAATTRRPFRQAAESRQNPALFAAKSRANEEVLLCSTNGNARFSSDGRYIAVNNKISLLDGRECGVHEGVWELLFDRPQDLYKRPEQPSPPLNRPVGPVQKGIVTGQTKARWAFSDGEIFASGPITSHLIPLVDGSTQFLISAAQVVTNGTGRFRGACGLVQSLGAAHVPASVDPFASGRPLPVTTLDTFKIRVVSESLSIATSASDNAPPATGSRTSPTTTQTRSESKYVEVLGSRMHYLDVGSGDPVLFLHGNPTSSYLWRNVIPHVSDKARCIAPDLIGMGQSDKPDIQYRFFDHVKYLDTFITTLGLKSLTLVLHDWGCMLGFFYAMRHEANVKGLAFMEAMFRPYRCWSEFPEALRETFQAYRTPDVGFERVVVKNDWLIQLLPASMLHKLTPAEMEAYLRPFREPVHRKPIWRLANELPIEGKPPDVTEAVSDYAKWLKVTSLPKLLLHADPGAITTKKDVCWARETLKNLRTVSIGKGVHFHQEDEPHAIGTELAEWYSTICNR